jgi:hypothetical protein
MVTLLALIFWLTAASLVQATDYQQCLPSSTCTIGEFLYDDSYLPDTGAACTLTAKYPDGSSFLNGVTASGNADGWYAYTAAIGTTTGLYRANLCCTSGSDYLCIDKSFEVKAAASPGATAAEIWSYSDRKLTGFDDLIKDIWNHSSRSLTTFGDLVSNVWNYSTAPTTTPAALEEIIAEQTSQRKLLEKLVNAPVVSFSLEDSQALPDLNSKLEQSQTEANALKELIQGAKKNIGNRSAIAALFDQPESLSYLTQAWETPAVRQLNEAIAAVKRSLTLEALENAEKALIPVLDFLDAVAERQLALEQEQQRLASLLNAWPDQDETALTQNLAEAKTRVLALNEYPGGETVIKPIKTSEDKKLNLKNWLFNLQTLLGLNRRLLAANSGQPVRFAWLEEGSIIFRGVITNPSAIISQTVTLKFYLPRELTKENVISLDPSLTVQYDPTEEALFVSGEYSLKPLATKLVFVETEDIWQLTKPELDSYRNQAAELVKPLDQTSYFAQGAILKTEIDTALDKIGLKFNKAIAPENRIRAFREAQLELAGVKTNLARLQDLAGQAANTGSIFGFVGGVQTVAVWGILLIVITSFVFLTLYMSQLKFRPAAAAAAAAPAFHRSTFWASPAVVPVLILITAITTIIISQLFRRPAAPAIIETKTSAASPSPSPAASPTAKPQEINVKQEKQVLGETSAKQLNVPKGGSVNVRGGPTADSPIVMTLKAAVPVFVWENKNGWLRISFEPADHQQDFWVSGELVD